MKLGEKAHSLQGSCFARLTPSLPILGHRSFSVSAKAPNAEFPLHLTIYTIEECC